MVRLYDHVRDALTYARRIEGDAERIAPSLYANRGSGRRAADEAPQTPTDGLQLTDVSGLGAQSAPESLAASLSANGPFQRTTSES